MIQRIFHQAPCMQRPISYISHRNQSNELANVNLVVKIFLRQMKQKAAKRRNKWEPVSQRRNDSFAFLNNKLRIILFFFLPEMQSLTHKFWQGHCYFFQNDT